MTTAVATEVKVFDPGTGKGLQVKGVKVHRDMSEETTCFSATLYHDGRKAARVSNDGHGGCNRNDWYASQWPNIELEVNAFVASLPEIDAPAGAEGWERTIYPMKRDLDWLVGELVEEYQHEKKLKRLAKGNTLFRCDDREYEPGEWQMLHAPDAPQAREWLTGKYPDSRIEVYNPQGENEVL